MLIRNPTTPGNRSPEPNGVFYKPEQLEQGCGACYIGEKTIYVYVYAYMYVYMYNKSNAYIVIYIFLYIYTRTIKGTLYLTIPTSKPGRRLKADKPKVQAYRQTPTWVVRLFL